MTVDTITRIASLTKAVTSAAVMQLVEQGRVSLDAPLDAYMPNFADTMVLDGFLADGTPILRKPESAVTIRQLLTHTSGYVYEIWNDVATRYAASGFVASIYDGGDGFLGAPLLSDPGTNWEYGISTDILGALVEVVSGQSLDGYLRENIFAPLNMPDTYFIVPEEKLSRLATAYAKSSDGELTPIPYSRPRGDYFSGGGGLFSTAGDYVRFMRAILRGGELDGVRILDAATVDLMARNQIGDLEVAVSFRSAAPALSNDVDFMPGTKNKFGLGFLINTESIPGGRSAGSLSWAGLYNAYYWIDRENDVCGVLITQVLPFFDADVLALFSEFEKAVYASAVH